LDELEPRLPDDLVRCARHVRGLDWDEPVRPIDLPERDEEPHRCPLGWGAPVPEVPLAGCEAHDHTFTRYSRAARISSDFLAGNAETFARTATTSSWRASSIRPSYASCLSHRRCNTPSSSIRFGRPSRIGRKRPASRTLLQNPEISAARPIRQ